VRDGGLAGTVFVVDEALAVVDALGFLAPTPPAQPSAAPVRTTVVTMAKDEDRMSLSLSVFTRPATFMAQSRTRWPDVRLPAPPP
jgi:hypothetical protein